MTDFYCEAFDSNGTRIGSFTVTAATMSEALTKAGKNIEVAVRPEQHEMRISRISRQPVVCPENCAVIQ